VQSVVSLFIFRISDLFFDVMLVGMSLRMHHISKRFGPTVALAGVSLEVAPGEVHALVGENGAGKSTLMKVLSGAVRPDAGTMTLDAAPFEPRGPHEARLRGVAMIYQELTLAPHLDVETNIMLGLEEHRWGFVRRAKHRRRVRRALELLAHPEIRPETPVCRLNPGARQLVEVARALVAEARVIVFDEPTSSLTHSDTEHLFALIERLKGRGVSIVYISHFLEEVQRVADRFTVLRDGRSVATGSVAGTTVGAMIEQMVGRTLHDLYPRVPHTIGKPVLEVVQLAGATFTLHRGEIYGLFGLVGAGRTELLRALFGLDPVRSGEVRIAGLLAIHAGPGWCIQHGMGLLSEDRKNEGLALTQSVADNLTASRLTPYARFGWLNLRRRRQAVLGWIERLRVRCRGPEQRVAELSGGNQQKVALARLLHQEADVLLLDEPTRGVDVGSKAEIYQLIGELAAQGRAILFVSSYLPELMGLCDRLAVMRRSAMTLPLAAGQWSADAIMASATGGAGA
jgi:ribose transport system ATP-binding protein